MKYDIILAGVGGQGVLSLAAIIAMSAMKDGLTVRQSEVHGMAQRGGAVLAHLRIADGVIDGDLIPKGSADMILSMEPLESLRYLDYLSPQGVLVTSSIPVENIPNYPELSWVTERVAQVENHVLVDSNTLAREAGSARATNMVMVGAASQSVPVSEESIISSIKELFTRKGEKVVEMNEKAFALGRG